MDLGAVSQSLIKLLEEEFVRLRGAAEGMTFDVFSSKQFSSTVNDHVVLYCYRVSVDQTRRHVQRPRPTPHDPSPFALALELRYVLTVWAGTAEREQQILGLCMDIFDRFALVSGNNLQGADWEPNDALKVTIDDLSNEDLLRLWDSVEAPYQLSIPYLVRTVRLADRQRDEGVLVESRINQFAPGTGQ